MGQQIRRLKVRANADTPKDCETALFLEPKAWVLPNRHMFFEGERITAVREMILSENLEERQKALDKLLLIRRRL